jgi:hypothetical protein
VKSVPAAAVPLAVVYATLTLPVAAALIATLNETVPEPCAMVLLAAVSATVGLVEVEVVVEVDDPVDAVELPFVTALLPHADSSNVNEQVSAMTSRWQFDIRINIYYLPWFWRGFPTRASYLTFIEKEAQMSVNGYAQRCNVMQHNPRKIARGEA